MAAVVVAGSWWSLRVVPHLMEMDESRAGGKIRATSTQQAATRREESAVEPENRIRARSPLLAASRTRA